MKLGHQWFSSPLRDHTLDRPSILVPDFNSHLDVVYCGSDLTACEVGNTETSRPTIRSRKIATPQFDIEFVPCITRENYIGESEAKC
jgi:hypothetical protein